MTCGRRTTSRKAPPPRPSSTMTPDASSRYPTTTTPACTHACRYESRWHSLSAASSRSSGFHRVGSPRKGLSDEASRSGLPVDLDRHRAVVVAVAARARAAVARPRGADGVAVLAEHAPQSDTRDAAASAAVGWRGAADLRRSRRRRTGRRRTQRLRRVASHGRPRSSSTPTARRSPRSATPTSPILPRSSLKPRAGARLPHRGRATRGRAARPWRPRATRAPTATSSVVRDILDAAGLGEEALGCPPAWPGDQADARRGRARRRRSGPDPHELLGQARRDAAHLRRERVDDRRATSTPSIRCRCTSARSSSDSSASAPLRRRSTDAAHRCTR